MLGGSNVLAFSNNNFFGRFWACFCNMFDKRIEYIFKIVENPHNLCRPTVFIVDDKCRLCFLFFLSYLAVNLDIYPFFLPN